MTDRALVPLDQPYGTRQATEQAIGQAAPRRAMPPDLLGAIKPTVQPNIQELVGQLNQPPPPPVDRIGRLREIRATTPNSTVAELIGRLLGE